MRIRRECLYTFMVWLAFVFAFVSPTNLYATSHEDDSLADFYLVKHLSEITDDGSYLIGAEYEVRAENRLNKGFCLMSCAPETYLLTGVTSTYPVAEQITNRGEENVWSLRFDASGAVQIYSPAMKLTVSKGSGASGLRMHSENRLSWRLEHPKEGVFLLRRLDAETRALGINWGPESVRFGAYLAAGNRNVELRIYKKSAKSGEGPGEVPGDGSGDVPGEVPGEAVLPADSAWVALMVDGKVGIGGDAGWQSVDARPYWLQHDKLANDGRLLTWRCVHLSDRTFTLSDQEGRGLDGWSDQIPPHQIWQIDHGYVATATAPVRYLVSEGDFRLRLVRPEELSGQKLMPVIFLPTERNYRFEELREGVKVLTGTWSAIDLAHLDWENVQTLDLTRIALPKYGQPFSGISSPNNHLIYVDASGEKFLPDAWENVVIRSADSIYHLHRGLTLYDRCPLMLHHPITLESDAVVYHRESLADGGWETLCVPFDAVLPDNLIGERLKEISADGKLIFEPTQEIRANEPVIFRPQESGACSFALVAKAGVMSPVNGDGSSPLMGTYQAKEVQEWEEDIYLLKGLGDSFGRALPGSRLLPFRAYLKVDHPMQVVHLEHPTGIAGEPAVLPTDRLRMGIYSLDGRCLRKEEELKKTPLPRGVYIIKGKKFLKQ